MNGNLLPKLDEIHTVIIQALEYKGIKMKKKKKKVKQTALRV